MPDAAASVLPASTRHGLLVMGLLQGMALYAVTHSDLWGYDAIDRSWMALCMLLIVQPPLFMAMAVVRWRQPALWLGGVVVALVVLAMGGWCVWRSLHSTAVYEGAMLRLAVAVSLWWLVALAWFQGYLEQGHWRIPYARLFVLAWNNALVMALSTLCVSLVWGVLMLGAKLFGLLGVSVFVTLFTKSWFVFACTGLLGGMGVWLARSQERPIQMARQTLLALGRMLLPLMAGVVVLFVVTLPFTGLENLWATGMAAGLLMTVLMLHIWLVNAVYQDGSAPQGPYGRRVLLLVHASLVAMPVLAVLACLAVGLRAWQYGWTAERVWAAAGAALLWLYAAGYAWAAIVSWRDPKGRPWLAPIGPVNRAMSWLVLALLLALQTPVLDPDRISVRSQLAQLASGAQEPTHDRLISLKFDYGPYGAAALAELAQLPVAQEGKVKEWVQQIGESVERDDVPSAANESEWVNAAIAQQRIHTASNSTTPAADWWDFLIDKAPSHHWASACLFESADCVVISGDWDRDGQVDHLLCDMEDAGSVSCQLIARAVRLPQGSAGALGAWQDEGRVDWTYLSDSVQRSGLRDALRAGTVQMYLPRWPQWQAEVVDHEGRTRHVVGQQR